jgi:hypothetical protein
MRLYYSYGTTTNRFVDIEVKVIKNKDTKKWGVWAFCNPYSMHLLTGTITRDEGKMLKVLLSSSDKKDLALVDVYKNLLEKIYVEVSGHVYFYTFSTKLNEMLLEMVKVK